MNSINRDDGSSSTDFRELSSWHDSLIPSIRATYSKAGPRYTPEGQLTHYRRVARKLWDRFGDPDLASAGFFHGITVGQLERFNAKIPPSVLTILQGWERLIELRPGVAGFRGEHQEAALHRLPDARSALLFVYERLDRFDPDDALGKWTRSFRSVPTLFEETSSEIYSADLIRDSERSKTTNNPGDFLEQAVAPAARYWGFWQEHTTLRDIALHYMDPERFRELVQFVVENHGLGGLVAENLKNRLEQKAPMLMGSLDIRWEWRHIASIAKALRDTASAPWLYRLHELGFVTIVCPDELSCYQVLGHLHQSHYFRREFFRDAIGDPTRSGYRALHTALRVEGPGDLPSESTFVSVRLIPREVDERRTEFVDQRRLEEFKRQMRVWRQEVIQVATPRRELRFLPLGSTVLEFAVAEDPTLVCRVRGARLNDKDEAGLFRLLQPGDIVEFLTGPLRVLPEGWESQVVQGSVARIRRALESSFSELLENAGREWLQSKLGEVAIDEDLFDLLAESVVADFDERHESLRWWLYQLGLLHDSKLRRLAGAQRQVEETQAQALRDAFNRRIHGLQKYLPVPDIDREAVDVQAIRRCVECRPSRLSALAYTLDDAVITIHREGDPCAQGAVPFVRQSLTHGQVFHVEAVSGVGVAQRILEVFSERGLNIVEVTVRSLTLRWGVARVESQPLSPAEVRELKADLERLSFARKVHGPGDPLTPIVVQALPPRVDDTQYLLDQAPSPFDPGVVSWQPQYFYGRRKEIRRLSAIQSKVRSGGDGQMVFVSGPLKVGKTSLAQQFQAMLGRDQRRLTFLAYVKCGVDQSWSVVQQALLERLESHVGDLLRLWGKEEWVPKGYQDLPGLLAAIQALPSGAPSVNLVIDEAVRLFGATNDPDAIRQIEAFCALVEQTPGVQLLWIGPRSPVRLLHPTFRDLLLNRCFQMPLGSLSETSIRQMLRAIKLEGFHRIEIDDAVAREVFELTGGDPFWTAHLGDWMWELAPRRRGEVLRFDSVLVERAMDRLLDQSTPFEGRFFPRGTEVEPEAEKLAVLLGFHTCSRRAQAAGEPPVCDFEALVGEVEHRGFSIDPEEARTHLEDLTARGALRQRGHHWRLAAPIVEQYIETYWMPELVSDFEPWERESER